MPSHTHIQDAHNHTQDPHSHTVAIKAVGNDTTGTTEMSKDGTTSTSSTTATNQATTATNQYTGGGQAHNNLPPYYALAFIMKL
jgi:microcystin-dependent protein